MFRLKTAYHRFVVPLLEAFVLTVLLVMASAPHLFYSLRLAMENILPLARLARPISGF